MTTTAIVLIVSASVAAVVDWWAVAKHRLGVEFIAKPLVIIALIGMALAIDTGDNVTRGLVVAALGASLVGDVVLMTPDARFEAGLAAFLLAHGLYIVALAPHVQAGPALAAALLVVAVGLGVIPELLGAARRQGSLIAVAVAGYIAALSVMTIFAAGTGVIVAVAGGALFFASDSLLGWARFVAAAPGGRVLVHITYHLGQFGLVLWLAA